MKKARCRGGNALLVYVFNFGAVCACVRVFGAGEYLYITQGWNALKRKFDGVLSNDL
ncbi:MAG TPA: hypothetical protein H9698_10510 [Candidatus Ruthenibacterium merdavium]|uniref:Uncharacterized protein n=1 Tax=Candidatus Ruthenibacterium merdavium TaxID=2838752 RepID=A0A9D2Q877_9FIRM|nr:hypothetical protein [Candidatus Ruthenibacterium merdavium]